MTAEEYLKYKYENYKPSGAQLIDMKEYARLKCQELLLLIAEKADKAYVGGWELDRDDVLNIIDLDSFCS